MSESSCQRPPSAVILDLPFAESLGCDLWGKIVNFCPGLRANSDVADGVLLLEMGGDDSVRTPFSTRELVDCPDR